MCLKTIYYSLAQSQLSFGILGWGAAYDNEMKKVEVAQNYILKIIYRKPPTIPCEELYSLSVVMNIRQIYVLHILKRIQSKIKIHKPEHSMKLGNMKTIKDLKYPRELDREVFYTLQPQFMICCLRTLKIFRTESAL